MNPMGYEVHLQKLAFRTWISPLWKRKIIWIQAFILRFQSLIFRGVNFARGNRVVVSNHSDNLFIPMGFSKYVDAQPFLHVKLLPKSSALPTNRGHQHNSQSFSLIATWLPGSAQRLRSGGCFCGTAEVWESGATARGAGGGAGGEEKSGLPVFVVVFTRKHIFFWVGLIPSHFFWL